VHRVGLGRLACQHTSGVTLERMMRRWLVVACLTAVMVVLLVSFGSELRSPGCVSGNASLAGANDATRLPQVPELGDASSRQAAQFTRRVSSAIRERTAPSCSRHLL
jgi:hypothetical protein